MLDFNQVSDPQTLLLECLQMEFVRYSETFNVLLAQYKLSRLHALRRLAASEYMPEYNYGKRGTIPCFCFTARRSDEGPALSFFVSFERDAGEKVHLWIQEIER